MVTFFIILENIWLNLSVLSCQARICVAGLEGEFVIG